MRLEFRFAPLVLGLVGILAVTCALLARRGSAASAAGAVIAFSPAASTLVPGATPVPTVDVTLSQAANVGGYDAWVQFNGAVVQMDSLTDAGFLANPNPQGTPQNFVTCSTPTVTATYGHLACSVLPLPSPFPPPVLPSAGLTPVALVHAAFSAAGSGTSPLSLTAVAGGTPETTLLLDINATPIAATLGPGTIAVGAASVGGVAEVASLPAQAPHGRRSPLIPLAAIAVPLCAGGVLVLRRRRAR